MRAGFCWRQVVTWIFMIHGLFKYRLFGQEFWITTTHVSILVVMLVLFVFALAANRTMRHAQEVPGFFQNIVEMIVEMLDGMVESKDGEVMRRNIATTSDRSLSLFLSAISQVCLGFGLRQRTMA